MAKRVFFSFHYQDVIDFRANVVRNHWLCKPDRAAAGFFDASVWESAKKVGAVSVKRLINSSISGTSSTCVLIGSETCLRPWVRYEIMKSFKKGNAICGVHINSIRGRDRNIKALGNNPLEYLGVSFSDSGLTVTFFEWKGAAWARYAEVDGSASYRCQPVALAYRGNAYKLSQLKPTFDWIKDDGYNNFTTWV